VTIRKEKSADGRSARYVAGGVKRFRRLCDARRYVRRRA